MVKKLPKIFVANAISLQNWGINEYAWEKNNALKIIDYILKKDCEIGLSGGDVYSYLDDNLELLYDNWYCDPFPNESILDFNRRSLLIAKKYIENYPIISENETLFSFVFSDYVVFEDEEEI